MPAKAKYEHLVQGEIKVPEGTNCSLKQRDLDLKLLVFAGLGDVDKVQGLLDAGANPNAKDQYGITALHWAAHSDYPKILKSLIKNGANLDARTIFGETTSLWATNIKFKTALDIKHSRSSLPPNNTEDMRSHFYGFYGFCEQECEEEVRLNNKLSRVVTYLKGTKTISTIELLIDEGANIGVINRNTHTNTGEGYREHLVTDDMPLHHAISRSNVSGVRTLLKENSNTHFVKRQFLLRHTGDDVEYKISIERPLHLVRYDGSSRDMNILRALLDSTRSADPNARDHNKRTPIYHAIEHGNVEAVDLLLHHNAKIQITDNQGITPLHLATVKNNFTLVSKFLELGANPNARDHKGKMPSQMTTDPEIERWLLVNGASSYATLDELHLIYKDEISHLSSEDKKQFMLFAAVKYGSLDAIKEALNIFPANKSINEIRDSSRRNPSHWAVIRNDIEIIRFLVEHGIDLNAMDIQERTSLSEARSPASTLLLNEEIQRQKCAGALVAR